MCIIISNVHEIIGLASYIIIFDANSLVVYIMSYLPFHKNSYDDDDDRTFEFGVWQGWSRNKREEVLEGNRINSREQW
jgi:hypothetical protein